MSEISSSSFEFYEGLRALVPGGFVVAIYAAICQTFGVTGTVAIGTTLVAVLTTLAVGFVLLFLDFPGKAAVVNYDTPVDHLRSWKDLAPRGDANHKNIYYEILDVEVPAGIKTKVYYFGAIYRIGFESIYIAAVAIPVLTLATLFPAVGTARNGEDHASIRRVFIAALVLHTVIVGIALRGRWGKIGSDLRKEMPLLDWVLLCSGGAGLAVNLAFGWRWVGVVAVAVPGTLWAVRYHSGVKQPGTSARRNLHAATAMLMYGSASISMCAIGARWAVSNSPLDGSVVAGWGAASLITAALITARDHEKKLLGVYATQRTWLDGKRDMLLKNGYLIQMTTDEGAAQSRQ
jgi:hypothetical protein